MGNFKVWPPCNIHRTVKIGGGTRIGAFCDIGKNVVIGKNCNIQAHVTIANECLIGDNVFIGPNTSLLNDKYMDNVIEACLVNNNAHIGGGVTVLPRVQVGAFSVVGAGSVVTKNVAPHSTVYGCPAVEVKP